MKKFASANFVCVRQVEMKNVDLSLFQFDHDLNWAGIFLNADGTIYARYGTQSEKGADAYNSIKGLLTTMQQVLKLHAKYPANKAGLVGKRAAAKPWKTATDIPTLNPNLRQAGKTTRSNCIHCHNIHDAENEFWIKNDTMNHDRLWRYPLPENIGLTVSPKDGRTILAVVDASPAQETGIQKGQQIDSLNGQLIASVADIQWVLHGLPNTDGPTVDVKLTDGTTRKIKLAKGWKQTDISWRGSLWSLSPRLRVWMPPLDAKERAKAGISDNQTALLVKWINRSEPGGRVAFEAGIREGDILLKVAGESVPKSPQELNVKVKLRYKVGDDLPITILRDGKEREMKWPLVE